MDVRRWEQVHVLFEAALAQPKELRNTYIATTCSDDLELRDEVLSLLSGYEEANADQLPPAWLDVLTTEEAPRFSTGDEVASRYQIQRLLGHGGMGEVYKAWDRDLSIQVALKILHFNGGSEKALQRLKLESLLARSVSHPNVCRVYDLGQHHQEDLHGSVWFITMEVLSGRTLAEHLHEAGRLPLDGARRFAEQMASGLGAIHQAGVIHCDFKSSNVMLVGNAGEEMAVVTDFGIARAASLQARETESRTSNPIMGTPAYAAPELLRGLEVSPATDIYSLGVVLYEMVTGQLPFVGSGRDAAKVRTAEDPPSPRSVAAEVDERWERVILRCLERDPRRRFDRAEEVAEALSGSAPIEPLGRRRPSPLRSTLPVERGAFFGREAEIEELARHLSAARFVTLLGPGGMGKTRLAVHYGRSIGHWPGGVWFCDLTEARSLEGIASAVASSLGVQLGRGDPIAQLSRAIAGRGRCLLILDNFEQAVHEAPVTLGRWLEQTTEATFLVTSRERLNVAADGEIQRVESLSPESALELFKARAQWLRPGLQFDTSETDAAREIVRLVDGMPLAIELAAARMRLMNATQIVQRMRKRFQLLTGGPSARHETVAVTLDDSWELLSAWEQSAWAQCAVFEGGFTLEAAEAVIDLSAWPESPWVMDIVQSLIDKSLLRTSVTATGRGERGTATRFGMYVSLQDYARKRLREEGVGAGGSTSSAERAAEERHGRWYARYGADEPLESLDCHGGVQRRRQLEREIENLGAACRRAVERGDNATSAAAYRAMCAVTELQGPFAAAVEVGRKILLAPELLPEERARTLRALGQMERYSGLFEKARAHLEAAVAIHRESDNPRGEGAALGGLGVLFWEQGRIAEARACYEAALAVARAASDPRLMGNILSNLGMWHASQGRMEEAHRDLETALAIHREIGNRSLEGAVLSTMGQMHFDQGRMEEARACGETALAIHREVGNRIFECAALGSLGAICTQEGDLEGALIYYEETLTVARSIGSLRVEGMALDSLGLVLHRCGRLEEAHSHFRAALAIHRQVGHQRCEGSTLTSYADLLIDQGNIPAAEEALMKAEEILRSLQHQIGLGQLLCVYARLEQSMGRIGAAEIRLAEAETIAAEAGCDSSSYLGRMIAGRRQALSEQRV